MAYDGCLVCEKCRRTLYLGKYKEGQFWPGVSQEQFAMGMAQFIKEHFVHGDLVVMGQDRYERFLESVPANEWPVTVYIKATHDGRVKIVEGPSTMRR